MVPGGKSWAAISADQVNLQTQNLEVEFVPAKILDDQCRASALI